MVRLTTSSAAREIDATAASGATVSGTGYSYSIPEGWAQADPSIAQGTDTVAVDQNPTGDFATNVNVVLSPAGEITPEQVETAAVKELEDGGGSDVTVLDRVVIAGGEAAHVGAQGKTSNGGTYRIQQYYPSHDGQTMVITFSYAEDVPSDEARGIAESVLASWTWK